MSGNDKKTGGNARKRLGDWGEEQACRYLLKNGYRLVERNFRCRSGEIDLIAMQGESTLCFIEVKTRCDLFYGTPGEAVNRKKQRRMTAVISYFLLCHPEYRYCGVRIDVIELLLHSGSAYIRHIENAF